MRTPAPDRPPIRSPLRLDEIVLRHARRQPARPALSMAGHTLDYAALADQVAAACARLQLWGIGPGERVACLSLNDSGMLVLLMALSRLGALLAPLNYRLAPAEWDQLMGDCSPSLVLHDAAWSEPAQALALRHGVPAQALADLATAATAVHTRPDSRPENDPIWSAPAGLDRPLLLVYTSGTTGRPRAAVHTHANLIANMCAASLVLGLTPHDHVLTVLPLFHVGGLCIQTLPALWMGAQVTLHPRFEPEAALRTIEQERIGFTVVVPAVMKALIEHPRWAQTDLRSLRCVSAGSSTLPEHLVRAFLARDLPLANVYGATETGPFSIAHQPDPALSLRGSCGMPAPGVEACLGPIEGAAPGTGEVCLRGPAIVRHYWPDVPALDDAGWFHSGDVATVGADGQWTLIGRCKDMIISGGENIYPAEIEGLLSQHPAVAECAVIGVPDARWGESVVAVVALHAGAQAHDDELLERVREGLARYKHPRRVVRMPALPKTALGKVQKGVLRDALSAP